MIVHLLLYVDYCTLTIVPSLLYMNFFMLSFLHRPLYIDLLCIDHCTFCMLTTVHWLLSTVTNVFRLFYIDYIIVHVIYIYTTDRASRQWSRRATSESTAVTWWGWALFRSSMWGDRQLTPWDWPGQRPSPSTSPTTSRLARSCKSRSVSKVILNVIISVQTIGTLPNYFLFISNEIFYRNVTLSMKSEGREENEV